MLIEPYTMALDEAGAADKIVARERAADWPIGDTTRFWLPPA